MGACRRRGLLGGGEVVAHAHELEVTHALVDVEGAVGQVALRGAGGGAELHLGQEVERGGGRGLEEEALHRTDAALGPVRQQHERHGGAISVDLLLVLPEGAAAAMLGTHLVHRDDEVSVLGVVGLALVAGVVPVRPGADEAAFVDAVVEPHPGVAAVGPLRSTRERSQRQPDQHQRHQQTHTRGDGRANDARLVGISSGEDGQGATHLRDPDGGQEIEAEVVEGQQAGVPEPLLGQHDEGHRHHHGGGGQDESRPHSEGDGQHQTHARQGQHPPQVVRRVDAAAGDQVLPVRLALEAEQRVGPGAEAVLGRGVGQLLPTHVVDEVRLVRERQHPERADEPTDRKHRRQPPERAPGRTAQQGDDQGDGQGEEGRDEMTQPGEGEEHRGQGAVLARAETADDHAEVDQGERKADRERELAGQGGGDVAAVDREVAVEQEQH